MAQAEVITKTEKLITLKLTEDEALAVRALTGNVNGCGKWRSATTAVFVSLDGVFPTDEYGPEVNQHIKFSEDL